MRPSNVLTWTGDTVTLTQDALYRRISKPALSETAIRTSAKITLWTSNYSWVIF